MWSLNRGARVVVPKWRCQGCGHHAAKLFVGPVNAGGKDQTNHCPCCQIIVLGYLSDGSLCFVSASLCIQQTHCNRGCSETVTLSTLLETHLVKKIWVHEKKKNTLKISFNYFPGAPYI